MTLINQSPPDLLLLHKMAQIIRVQLADEPVLNALFSAAEALFLDTIRDRGVALRPVEIDFHIPIEDDCQITPLPAPPDMIFIDLDGIEEEHPSPWTGFINGDLDMTGLDELS